MFIYTKKIILAFCLTITLQQASASPAKIESVKKLLTLVNIQNVLQNELNEIQPVLDQQAENILKHELNKPKLTTTDEVLAVLEISQILKTIHSQALKTPAMLNGIEQIYAQTFTEEEIQTYIRFLTTNEGRSIQQKHAKLQVRLIQNSRESIQDFLTPQEDKKLKEQVNQVIQALLKK